MLSLIDAPRMAKTRLRFTSLLCDKTYLTSSVACPLVWVPGCSFILLTGRDSPQWNLSCRETLEWGTRVRNIGSHTKPVARLNNQSPLLLPADICWRWRMLDLVSKSTLLWVQIMCVHADKRAECWKWWRRWRSMHIQKNCERARGPRLWEEEIASV